MEEADKPVLRGMPRARRTEAEPRAAAAGQAAERSNPLPNMDDMTLLLLAGQGDENAMAAIFDRYAKPVYSVALRVLRDTSAAEDVLQEVFLQVWRRPEALVRNRSWIGPWLMLDARNRALGLLRRMTQAEEVDRVVLPDALHGNIAGPAAVDRARAAVQRINPEQRKAVELAFFDGLTHTEMAETTGEAVGTVRSRLRAALLQLRKDMSA